MVELLTGVNGPGQGRPIDESKLVLSTNAADYLVTDPGETPASQAYYLAAPDGEIGARLIYPAFYRRTNQAPHHPHSNSSGVRYPSD